MRSRLCKGCATSWPLSADFQRCPSCASLTVPSVHPSDFSLPDAQRLRAEYRFERFYQRREARKKREGLPLPEDMGLMAAREELELDRRLTA